MGYGWPRKTRTHAVVGPHVDFTVVKEEVIGDLT